MATLPGAGWPQTTQNTSAWISQNTSAWISQTTQNTSALISDKTSGWTSPDNNSQSLADLPTDCILLGLNATVPWDNPDNLISYETENLLEQLKSAVFIPILFLIGVPSNVVNMAVFFKQGLKDRINMCLFALAVTDVLNIIFGFVLYAERMYTQFTDNERFTPSFRYIMNSNVLGLVGFVYGPPLLSAVVATERCVCVLFPLRAQRCMPTKALALVILVAVSLVVSLRFAVTSKYEIACVHEVLKGRTTWQVFMRHTDDLSKTVLTLLDGVLYGFVIFVGCPVVVFFVTTITAIKLSQIVRWRRQATSSSSSSSSAMSSKEVGLTKMLICLSVEFFVLSIPIVVGRVLPLFVEGLSHGGLYTNTNRALVSLYELCSFVNSSVNFFVYYATGTKFRHTLHSMLARSPPAGDMEMTVTTLSSSQAHRLGSDPRCTQKG